MENEPSDYAEAMERVRWLNNETARLRSHIHKLDNEIIKLKLIKRKINMERDSLKQILKARAYLDTEDYGK